MSRRSLAGLLGALCLLLAPAAASGRTVAVDPDGRIVLSEVFADVQAREYDPPPARGIARLGPDVAPDPSFGRNGFVLDRLGAVVGARRPLAAGPDGSVVEALAVARESGTASDVHVRRLLPDGAADESLGAGGVKAFELPGRLAVTDVVVRDGGRLLLAGSHVPPGGGRAALVLVALERDARLDLAFGGGDGIASAGRPDADASARNVSVLPDGRVLAGGEGLVARFTPDGELDPAFATGGRLLLGGPRRLAAASGSGVLLAYGAGTEGIVVERRRQDGTLDPDWGDGGRAELGLAAGPDVSYAVTDLLARAGGGAAVGAVRRTTRADPDPACREQDEAEPVLVSAGGDLERQLARSAAETVSLARGPGGGLVAEGLDEYAGCGEPGAGSRAAVVAYDATGDEIARRIVRPQLAPPDVQIASGPPRETSAVTGDSARFELAVTPPRLGPADVALRCKLRDAPFAPCPADGVFAALAEGPATLVVRALGIDGAPSEDRRYDWTVNHRAPTTTVAGAPPSLTRETGARLTFTADEPATFICRVDQRETEPCDGGITLSGLSDGYHQVTVRARDALGAFEAEAKVIAWTIDTRPPVSFVEGGPAGETAATEATFPFGATEPGSRFECSVDGGPFAACASPLVLRGLAPGAHSVTVRAIDALGNADPVGVTRRWTVLPPQRTTPPGGGRKAAPVRLLAVGRVLRGRVRVRLRSPEAGVVRLRLTVAGRGSKRVAAGTRRVRVRAGRAVTVRVRLTRKGRRALRAAQRRGVARPLRVTAARLRSRR